MSSAQLIKQNALSSQHKTENYRVSRKKRPTLVFEILSQPLPLSKQLWRVGPFTVHTLGETDLNFDPRVRFAWNIIKSVSTSHFNLG